MNRRAFLKLAGMAAVALPLTSKLGWAPIEAAPLSIEPVDMHHGPVPPVGSIFPWAGEKVPEGWLLCDGQAVSAIKYPRLAKTIEDAYGRESHRFRVPDMRGSPRTNVYAHRPDESPVMFMPQINYLIKAV